MRLLTYGILTFMVISSTQAQCRTTRFFLDVLNPFKPPQILDVIHPCRPGSIWAIIPPLRDAICPPVRWILSLVFPPSISGYFPLSIGTVPDGLPPILDQLVPLCPQGRRILGSIWNIAFPYSQPYPTRIRARPLPSVAAFWLDLMAPYRDECIAGSGVNPRLIYMALVNGQFYPHPRLKAFFACMLQRLALIDRRETIDESRWAIIVGYPNTIGCRRFSNLINTVDMAFYYFKCRYLALPGDPGTISVSYQDVTGVLPGPSPSGQFLPGNPGTLPAPFRILSGLLPVTFRILSGLFPVTFRIVSGLQTLFYGSYSDGAPFGPSSPKNPGTLPAPFGILSGLLPVTFSILSGLFPVTFTILSGLHTLFYGSDSYGAPFGPSSPENPGILPAPFGILSGLLPAPFRILSGLLPVTFGILSGLLPAPFRILSVLLPVTCRILSGLYTLFHGSYSHG